MKIGGKDSFLKLIILFLDFLSLKQNTKVIECALNEVSAKQ